MIFGATFCYVAGSALASSLVPKETRDRLKALSKEAEDLAANQKKTQEDELDKLNKDPNKRGDGIKIKRLLIGQQTENVSQLSWVPIPLWTIKTRSPNYNHADPEWKEFLKLEEDSERMHDVKNNVARQAAATIVKAIQPGTKRTLGLDEEISYSVKHVEVVFPFSPPDLYERPGLLIGSSSVAFATKPLPSSQGGRYHRIFHPTVVLGAFYAGGQVFFKHHYAVLMKRVSGSEDRTAKPLAPGKAAKGYTAAEKEQLDKSFGITKAGDQPKSATEGSLSDEASDLLKMLLPSPDKESALSKAAKAYKRHISELQIAALRRSLRGACYVTGFVDLYGSKATARIHVTAVYFPSQDVFFGDPKISADVIIIPKVGALTADMARREKTRQKLKPVLDKARAESAELSDQMKAHNEAREAHIEKFKAFKQKSEAAGKKLDGVSEKHGGVADRIGSETGETDARQTTKPGSSLTVQETAEAQQLEVEKDVLAAEQAKLSDDEAKIAKDRDRVLAQSDAILKEVKALSQGNSKSKEMKLKEESERDSSAK